MEIEQKERVEDLNNFNPSIKELGGYRYFTAVDSKDEINRLLKEGKRSEALKELSRITKWLKETEGMFQGDNGICSSCGSPSRNCIC